jgi:hypothetical protein
MDAQRSMTAYHNYPADRCSGGCPDLNITLVYKACVAWEKRRGLHRDKHFFGKQGWQEGVAAKKKKIAEQKKEVELKITKIVKEVVAKPPKVKLTEEELREKQRIRVAAYRAKNAEQVKVARKEYSRKHRANMTEEQKENRRINERRWAAERRERGTGR